jgi:hypothetical protein
MERPMDCEHSSQFGIRTMQQNCSIFSGALRGLAPRFRYEFQSPLRQNCPNNNSNPNSARAEIEAIPPRARGNRGGPNFILRSGPDMPRANFVEISRWVGHSAEKLKVLAELNAD